MCLYKAANTIIFHHKLQTSYICFQFEDLWGCDVGYNLELLDKPVLN